MLFCSLTCFNCQMSQRTHRIQERQSNHIPSGMGKYLSKRRTAKTSNAVDGIRVVIRRCLHSPTGKSVCTVFCAHKLMAWDLSMQLCAYEVTLMPISKSRLFVWFFLWWSDGCPRILEVLWTFYGRRVGRLWICVCCSSLMASIDSRHRAGWICIFGACWP